MRSRPNILRLSYALILIGLFAFGGVAQGVKRIVEIKVDGLPSYFVDELVRQRDPATGQSKLPWINEIFYKNGSRLANFYTRGMSLSGPAWGQLDTGQHLQIKGNVEFDRFTMRSYDYLVFFQYFLDYVKKKAADMPGTEEMDRMKIPLLYDIFPYGKRYLAMQLYQRGNEWEVWGKGFKGLFPNDRQDLMDEYALGIGFQGMTIDQNERDIIKKLGTSPNIDYFDYYEGNFDHVSHGNNDTQSRYYALKKLDLTIGRIWVAIQNSSRADETAMILVSDHGFNTKDGVVSQGFNLIKLMSSAAGGGHHVVTKRRPMLDYTIKGALPIIPLVITPSPDSYYLQGQNDNYPTALIDIDGNERSSMHFRNSDLNTMQILLEQMQKGGVSPDIKNAAAGAFFDIIDRHRAAWQQMVSEVQEEINALDRWADAEEKVVGSRQKRFSVKEIAAGIDKAARRADAQIDFAHETKDEYQKYLSTVTNLLSLKRDGFDAKRIKIEDYIAPRAMGDPNSVNQLENYVVGPSATGLTLDADHKLDMARSFKRVNYFEFLHQQEVLNNVQRQLDSHPIDFVSARIPARSFSSGLRSELGISDDVVFVYGSADKQALILARTDADGDQSFRYLPVSNLTQDENGNVTFKFEKWGAGFPLRILEDKDFAIPEAERVSWLQGWHTDLEWLHATHKTVYSNGVIGLNEQMIRHPLSDPEAVNYSPDEKLIQRLFQRQRGLTEADILILGNNHWNFDARGFNPGGNHGSFFRVSTNSTLMFAGGAKTGIPRGQTIEEPYDGLSLVPTVLSLMGRMKDGNQPDPELYKQGYGKFPGRVITEVVGGPAARR